MRHGTTAGVGLGVAMTVASWLAFPGAAAAPQPEERPAIDAVEPDPAARRVPVPEPRSSVPVVADPPTTTVPPDRASAFVDALNEARAAAGVAPVVADAELSVLAQSWADRLAADGRLHHSALIHAVIEEPYWTAAGENVGYGPDVAELVEAFIASPSHAANIVNPRYNAVGVGVVVDGDGVIWTAHLFAG